MISCNERRLTRRRAAASSKEKIRPSGQLSFAAFGIFNVVVLH
jgi:hypothetical protein